MKAKRITALLTALTLTVALSACGKENIELAQSGTENETESKVSKETKEVTESTEETTEEATEESTEEVTEESTEEVTEEETEKETNQYIVQAETSSSSSGSGKTVAGSSSSSSSESNATTTHTHNWKEHTATTQVWVPNIVTVDDYEEQVRETYYYVCDCGARFDTAEELVAHDKASMLNAAEKARLEGRNLTPDDCACGGSTIYTDYVTETVKVGSHEEDHGHYENSTYVDYYYCDCGATK